ncbi:hypothetical protein [Bifidobacterium aquikefiricola]|uniref:Uncharacterized protein n=1 Tax=Bifidobacterium aquikefiricola TaxID=3059038 RepID=A0AB39U7S5_9BIFI
MHTLIPLTMSFYITLAGIPSLTIVFLGHLTWCFWDTTGLDETLDGRLLKWEITAEKILLAMLAATFAVLCITFG